MRLGAAGGFSVELPKRPVRWQLVRRPQPAHYRRVSLFPPMKPAKMRGDVGDLLRWHPDGADPS